MLLEVRGLVSGYGRVTVLHGVDLKASAGEIVAVLGPNGAGKSTLMKTVGGHLQPTTGEVLLDGRDITGFHAQEAATHGIGYVPQEHNVFRDLTVRDNLRVAALSQRGTDSGFETVFERFPILAQRSSQRAATLSGGERQTLAVSSALIGEPKVLLLDEPTSGLAPLFIRQMVEWVEELAGSGMGVIWVIEQNPEMILAASTRAYLMHGGRVTDEFEGQELLKPGRIRELLLEERQGAVDESSTA